MKLLLAAAASRHAKMTGPPLRGGQKFLTGMTTNAFDKPFQISVLQNHLINKLKTRKPFNHRHPIRVAQISGLETVKIDKSRFLQT